MAAQPTLQTERLILRPLAPQDAPVVSRLAGQRQIADTTSAIPHPYSEQQALQWIVGNAELLAQEKIVVFGIQLKREGNLIGTIGLRDIDATHSQAELGYWIAVGCWGKGYATEAADLAVWYGFKHLKLNRIYAHYRVSNEASGRVLAKLCMKQEGLMRQCVRKDKGFEDMVLMALLREEWVQK